MKNDLPPPDLLGQFSTGLRSVANGRVFLAWDTGVFFTWWLIVTVGDWATTGYLLRGGTGEEANPVMAWAFATVGPHPAMAFGSLICLALAVFTVGDHRREDTYVLLAAPTGVLILKTWAVVNNSLLIL